MSLVIRSATTADLPAVFAVRHEVFVLGQGVPQELELDRLDADADHVLAEWDGQVAGTGRLVDGRIDEAGALVAGTAGTVGTIGRMAVRAPVRGRGIGRAVLDRLLERAAERRLPVVELHAQVHALGFYEQAGFAPVGPVYLEAGIEHQGMHRPL